MRKANFKIYCLLVTLLLVLCGMFVLPAKAATYSLETPEIEYITNSEAGVYMSWTPIDGAETYTILRKVGDTGSWTKKVVTTETHWTDTASLSGKTYYYAVRCSNASGTKYTSLRNPDGEKIFCINTRNISVSNTVNGVKLSWSKISNVSKYNVFRKIIGKDEDWQLLKNVSTNSFLDTEVQSGTTYKYAVSGTKTIDTQEFNGAISDAKTKTITFIAPPEIKDIKQNATQITVSWNSVDGAEAYTILRKVNDGSWYKKATVTDTSWTDTASKTSGNVYTYAVRPSTIDGSKYTGARYPDGVSYTYLKKPVIKKINNQFDGVKIDISIVKTTQQYEIHRIESREDEVIASVTNTNKSTVSFIDTSAENEHNYEYYVVAIYDDTHVSSDIHSIQYIDTSKTEYVALSFIALYEENDSTSSFITLPYMTELKYLDTVSESSLGKWMRVKYYNDIYYIWQDNNEPEKLTETSHNLTYQADNPYVSEAISEALNIYQNQKTVYRRNDSTGIPDVNGFYGYDCSGFVSYVIRNTLRTYIPTFDYYAKVDKMYELETLYNNGLTGEFQITDVSLNNIQPGDLIFFNLADESGDDVEDTSMPNHVGMYLGNNEFIHCTHYNWGGEGVFLMPLDEYYTSNIVAIRRFIPEEIVSADTAMYINAARANLKKDMDVSSDTLETILGNTEVKVLFTNNTWAYVEYNNNYYFIRLVYLMDTPQNQTFVSKIVAKTKISLYSEPSTSSEKITLIAADGILYGGQFFDSSYHVIRMGDEIWYYYTNDNIENTFVDSVDDMLANSTTYTVTSSVNMRMEPNSSATIIRQIKKKETVTVLAMPNPDSVWCFIQTQNGEYGFVSISYLEVSE